MPHCRNFVVYTKDMKIYAKDNSLIADAIITQDAVHEQELMKSDFVRLAWNDIREYTLPVGAYIQYNGINYYLFAPYEPQRKNEVECRYEPEFWHPFFYLSHIPYTHKDDDDELLEWAYTGMLDTLLVDIGKDMRTALIDAGLIPDTSAEIKVVITDTNIVSSTISTSFSSVDYVSALNQIANANECEWYFSWEEMCLYYGLISVGDDAIPLTEDENITYAAVRDAKEGYWNAYLPQGGTKNIAKKISKDYISANARLTLDKTAYPDGVMYTDSSGNIITKAEFDASGEKKLLKTLMFDNVYPKLDLYVYNARQRTRILYEDEETKKKAIAGYNDDGTPIYERYADWYIRLAYPEYNASGDVVAWHDFDGLTRRTPKAPVAYKDGEITVKVPFVSLDKIFYTNGLTGGTAQVKVQVDGISCNAHIDVAASYTEPRLVLSYYDDNYDAVRDKIISGVSSVLITEGIIMSVWSECAQQLEALDEYTYTESIMISGKTLSCRFVPNADSDLPSALAGRDFELTYYDTPHTIKAGGDDEDTGMEIHEGDFLIIRTDGEPIIPTTSDNRLIPYGDAEPSLRGNIVNLYNIVMSDDYMVSARNELAAETQKQIRYYFTDNNSYDFKSIPAKFRDSGISLHVGRKVLYTDLSGYQLETRVIKVTKNIDFDCIQSITVGNKVIRGTITQLKEDVKVLMTGGLGGTTAGMPSSGTATGSTSSSTGLYLSKITKDKAKEIIEFEKGIKTGRHGVDGSGNAILNTVKTTSIILGDYSADSLSNEDDIDSNRQFCFRYDEDNDAIYVVKADGSPLNFYATGGISALGFNGNVPSEGTGGHTIVVSGSGNAITDVVESSDGKTLTFYKGYIEGGGSSNGGVTEDWIIAQGFAKQEALDSHVNNNIRHITSAERESWNSTTSRLNAFLDDTDTDTIINKWSELETFLSGLSETDNLALILGNKANKDDVYTKTESHANYVRYVGISGDYVQAIKGDTTENLLIPFATETTKIRNIGEVSDLNDTSYWDNKNVITMATYGADAANVPEVVDNANMLINFCMSKHGTIGYYGWQMALQDKNDGLWMRRLSANPTTQYIDSWLRLWHSGNVDPLDKTKGGSIANDLAIRGILEVGETTYLNEVQMGDEIYLNNNWLNFDKAGSAFMGMRGEDIYITCDGIVDVDNRLKAASIQIGVFTISVENNSLKISRTDGAQADVFTTGGLTALA